MCGFENGDPANALPVGSRGRCTRGEFLETRRTTSAGESGAKARVGAGAARGLGSGVGGVPGAQCPEWNEVVVAVARAVVGAGDSWGDEGSVLGLVKVVELLLA